MVRAFRRPGPFRIVYWIVMLSAVGALLWYMKQNVLPLYQP